MPPTLLLASKTVTSKLKACEICLATRSSSNNTYFMNRFLHMNFLWYEIFYRDRFIYYWRFLIDLGNIRITASKISSVGRFFVVVDMIIYLWREIKGLFMQIFKGKWSLLESFMLDLARLEMFKAETKINRLRFSRINKDKMWRKKIYSQKSEIIETKNQKILLFARYSHLKINHLKSILRI